MKPKLRRWLSVPLSVAMLFCMMPTTAMTITAADEQPMLIGDENPIVTYAQPDVQEGVILHCFDWSFDNIKANMADIAAAGYTAIQTSPIQRCKQVTYGDTNEVWWAYYQPGSFYIENVQNRSALGDKDDFIAMCEVAHQYGIKVIVDVVANHLGNDGDYTKSAAILPDYLLEDQYWHDNWNVKANHNIREQSINYSLGGLPDLNTENATIQQLVLDYLKECIDAGADGFRFDAAKHIGVDADGTQYTFWKNTIPAAKTYYLSTENRPDDFKASRLYCYGEVLDTTQAKSYTKYLDALTDTVGNGVRGYVAGHNAGGAGSNNYYNPSLQTTQKVLWAESHDTYSNEEKESTYVSESDINKTWALVSAREGATALYFARTNGYRGGKIGEVYSTQWYQPEVVAANKFHNIFYGQSEYLSDSGNIAYNERGSKGVVLVNVNGTTANVSVTAHKMADGTYTDQVSGNTFTVSNGTISGTIGSTGIAVVYNDDDTVEDTFTVSKLYLVPGKWDKDGATFKACLYNNNTKVSQEIAMTVTEDSTVYKADVPTNTEWTKVKFQRIGVDGTTVWNYTNDYFLENGNNRYSVTSTEDWNGNIGLWDTYTTCEHTYGTPTWTWNGTSSATATFTCTQNCGVSRSVNAAISSTPGDTTVTYTATVTFNGQTYTDTKTVEKADDIVVYFDLSNKTGWLSDNAEFAMYVWNGNNNTWLDLTPVADSTALYYGEIPADTWENVIFCRMNPARDANRWGTDSDTEATKPVWGQTVDLAIPTNGNNCFVMNADKISSGNDSGKYSGTWSTYAPIVHTHTYGAPEWIWEDDFSGASAVFACTGCDDEQYENAEVSVVLGDGTCTYTAAVTRDGTDYTDIQTVNDVTAAMLSKCEAYKKLSTDNQGLYRRLLTFARSVVRGEQTSSVFTYTPDFQTTWTSAELGLGSTATSDEAFAAVRTKITELFPYSNRSDMAAIMNALMADWPYEFYWFASTQGYTYNQATVDLSGYGSTGAWTITLNAQPSFNVTMQVSLNYQDGTTTSFDTDAMKAVNNTVPAIAQTIVTQYANASDYAKLQGYAQAICQATDYNNLAAAGGTNAYDVDPWQLVYVFDNDPVTTVVCEGYSKAFKYLCSLTAFNSSLVKCYLVSGSLGYFEGNDFKQGAHMWNVVTMEDGKNYLVDVTNSDDSSNRQPNAFLLNGGSCDENGLYAIPSRNNSSDILYYHYDTGTQTLWGDSILTLNATNYAEPVSYTVTWKNEDGTVLETDTNVTAGTMPSYDGATPTKAATAQYSYTFDGWSPAVAAVTGDVTYTATFTKTTGEYTITWKMDDGSTIDTATVAYGTTPTHADAVKDADAQYTYTFAGWTPAVTAVTGEATYTAQFTATPIQTETIYYLVGTMNGWAENPDYAFVRNEGCTTAEEYMLTNVELAANAEFKVKSSKNDWFPGGSTLNDTVPAAGTYTIYFRPNWDGTNKWYYGAIYAQNVTPYTVTFDPANNDAVTTQTVTYGNTATAPETAPAKYGYDFMGWYNGDEAYEFDTPVTGDLTLTAHWREKQVSVTYTDINGINTVSFVGMVTGTYTLPSTPYLDGYDFDGWTVNSNPYTNKDAVLAQIDSLVKSESPVFVQVVYTKNEAQHTVSFDDGTEIGTYQVSDLVTITADTQSNGLTFDHWERIKSGTSTTVSYNAKYSFFMPDENVVLRAVYQEVPEAKGVAFIEKVTVNAADQKISFVAVCNVPQEYKMVKGGLVATNDSTIGENVSAEEGQYTFLKISTKTTENTKNLKYTWTKSNVNAGDTWYVKAYLVYTNTNNEEITVYSDAVTASLN